MKDIPNTNYQTSRGDRNRTKRKRNGNPAILELEIPAKKWHSVHEKNEKALKIMGQDNKKPKIIFCDTTAFHEVMGCVEQIKANSEGEGAYMVDDKSEDLAKLKRLRNEVEELTKDGKVHDSVTDKYGRQLKKLNSDHLNLKDDNHIIIAKMDEKVQIPSSVFKRKNKKYQEYKKPKVLNEEETAEVNRLLSSIYAETARKCSKTKSPNIKDKDQITTAKNSEDVTSTKSVDQKEVEPVDMSLTELNEIEMDMIGVMGDDGNIDLNFWNDLLEDFHDTF